MEDAVQQTEPRFAGQGRCRHAELFEVAENSVFDAFQLGLGIFMAFGVKAEAHKDDEFLLGVQNEQAQMFGLPCNDLAPALGNYLNDGDIVEIAEIRLQVIHVAGHSPGGLAFFCENPGKVNGQDNVPPLLFPGDIIFAGSRGRSDLYGGDEFALVSGIKSKLLTLPAETVVFPGHGPSTTIGNEKGWY